MGKRIADFWQRYLSACGCSSKNNSEPVIDEFGDNPELADELVGLILEGKKTGSCSLLSEYERDGDAIPKIGDKKVVVNGREEPVCVIETTDVEIKPYCEVDETFAYDEGEGDRTFASWDREHRKYFRRVLSVEGKEFKEDMLLICERFKVLYFATQPLAFKRRPC